MASRPHRAARTNTVRGKPHFGDSTLPGQNQVLHNFVNAPLVRRCLKSALRRTEVIYSRKDTASADPNFIDEVPNVPHALHFLQKSAELAMEKFYGQGFFQSGSALPGYPVTPIFRVVLRPKGWRCTAAPPN